MTRHDPKRLSDEDRILWNRVARTTVPLDDKTLEPEPKPPPGMTTEGETSAARPAGSKTGASAKPARTAQRPRRLDDPTRNKLARGRLPIEGRVDLHGLTQAEAHRLLLSFLRRARAAGLRHVLIITGKGSSGGGVLRRAVPEWLKTAPFGCLVSGHGGAVRRHGGEGAIYVRLRRAEPTKT